MYLKLRTLLLPFFVMVFAFFTNVSFAQTDTPVEPPTDVSTATVSTDKADYAPGDTVKVSGTGWQPGETVLLHFDETPTVCVNGHNRYAVADENGNIFNDTYLIEQRHIGVSFLLTATGQTSGFTAQATFTDGPSYPSGISLASTVDKSVCLNSDLTLTANITTCNVTGSGNAPTNITYRWYYNTDPADGNNVSTATLVKTTNANTNAGSNSYTPPNDVIGTRYYFCRVTQAVTLTGSGCGTIGTFTTSTVKVTVNPATNITGQPSSTSACIGGSASFTVTATGAANLTYQWQIKIANNNYSNISAATNPSAATNNLTISPVSSADLKTYRCVLTGGNCDPIFTNDVTLTSNTATSITTQPVSNTFCEGATASFTVAAGGTDVSYQWEDNSSGSFEPISGQQSATLNLANVTTAMNGRQYRVVVTGTCGTAISSTVILTVTAAVTISGQPTTQTVVYGDKATYTVTVSGGTGVTYQWQEFKGSGQFANISNGSGSGATSKVTYAGATTNKLEITRANVTDMSNKYQYRCVISSTGACAATVTSDQALIKVTPKLVVPSFTANDKVYDRTDVATINTETLAGELAGDAVSLKFPASPNLGFPAFSDRNVNVSPGWDVTAFNLSLTGNDAANYTLFDDTHDYTGNLVSSAKAKITPLGITGSFTVAPTKVYDGTVGATVISRTPIGVISPDVVSLIGGTATYDNKNVGNPRTVTLTGATLSGAQAGNYSLISVNTTTAGITQRGLTVTAVTASKIYDGGLSSNGVPTIAAATANTGLVSGDVVNQAATQVYDDKNVRNTHVMTASGLTIKDALGANMTGNYDITYNTVATGIISPRGLTVSAVTDSKTYDGGVNSDGVPTIAASTSTTGLVAGDEVNQAATQVYDDKNVRTTHTMTASGLTIKDANGDNMTGNYNIAYNAVTTGIISKRDLTVNAVADTKIYNGNVTSSGVPTIAASIDNTGLVAGDAVNQAATQVYDDKNVRTTHTMIASGLTIKDADGVNMTGNYNIAYNTVATGVINQRDLIVTAVSTTKTYDGTKNSNGAPTIATATATTGLVYGDVVNQAATQVYDNKDYGTAHVMTASGLTIKENVTNGANMTGNYNIIYNTVATGVINKKALTVTAKPATKSYDCNVYSPNPVFSGVIFNGFIAGEDETIAGVLGGTLTYSTTPISAPTGIYLNVGTHKITVSGLTATNYAITYGTNTLTVTPQTATPVAQTFYTGSAMYWTTSSSSGTASLTLSATIKNSLCGDIRTARVSFYVRTATGCTPIANAQNLPVNLVNTNDQAVGTASATVQYTISSNAQQLDIAVKVTGNYIADDPRTDAVISIAKPLPGGQIVGGGRLCNDNTAGFVKASPGTQTCYGFNVTYNKSLTSMQGGVDITVVSMYDRNGTLTTSPHTYKIRSNSITTLAIKNTDLLSTAQFSGKANISEIINGVEQSIEGNCQMQLDLFDGNTKDPVQADRMAIIVYRNKGGVWYTNNWDGSKSVQGTTCFGDLSTTGGGTNSTTTTVSNQPVTMGGVIQEATDAKFGLTAFPVPSASHFNIHLQSSNTTDKITLRMVDAQGRTIQVLNNLYAGQTVKVGGTYIPGIYFAEMQQGKDRKLVKLLKVVY
jgi:hypothetical protein